jgi:hypothetical protein
MEVRPGISWQRIGGRAARGGEGRGGGFTACSRPGAPYSFEESEAKGACLAVFLWLASSRWMRGGYYTTR